MARKGKKSKQRKKLVKKLAKKVIKKAKKEVEKEENTEVDRSDVNHLPHFLRSKRHRRRPHWGECASPV